MVKLRILLLCALMLPTLASAEIYKWKDKDGKVRYTDIPPPSNIKQETLYGKKIPKPTGKAPLAVVEGDATVEANKRKAAAENLGQSKEDLAIKRSVEAEQKKRSDDAKQAELKVNEENCKAAQANLRAHTAGGRIMKANEKGEREFLSETEVDKGVIDSQAAVDKYCN